MKKRKSIETTFTKMINLSLLSYVLMILFGFVMLFDPDFSTKFIGSMIGIMLMINAMSIFYNYFKRDGAKLFSLNLVFGMLIALLGAVLIVYPYTLIDFIFNLFGVYLIISAGIKLNYAFWLKKANEETWLITLVNAAMVLILALLFLFCDFIAIALTQVIGIFIVFSSILNVMEALLLKKRSKEITKIFW